MQIMPLIVVIWHVKIVTMRRKHVCGARDLLLVVVPFVFPKEKTKNAINSDVKQRLEPLWYLVCVSHGVYLVQILFVTNHIEKFA